MEGNLVDCNNDHGLLTAMKINHNPQEWRLFTDSYNKSQRDALFLIFIGKELYMFQTDLLSIIRSLNTVFTAIGIFHTSYISVC